ncbi:MAG: NAD-dependent protein deacetylase [Halieaceae bacterium]|jgi:NAD-dependent SIR2 family protein deacetylase|nr:NAD-dependent protein deacetylase [Halieaceae bacterium]
MTPSAAQLEATLSDPGRRWVILTGAGASAASGIPTYRDRAGKWLGSEPIKHQDFIHNPHHRQRYWARSMLGWPGVRDAQPNRLHKALAAFETTGRVGLLITQNVDRLHQQAGSQQVVDLHGRLDRVRCLDCGAGYEREDIQQRLLAKNPQHPRITGVVRPDGDAEIPQSAIERLAVVDCDACGGMLMPDVVFFGGSVPKARVAQCEQAIQNADGVLVVGSSLQVFSGFRFARQAKQLGKSLIIVNEGITRADDLADLKIEQQAIAHLTEVLETISPPRSRTPAQG